MKQFVKVVGTGCSFSDYTGNPKNTFNQQVALHYGIDYLDLTAGAGSNDRWYRLLLAGIREGVITKDDLIVIQYTNLMRREYVTDLRDPKESASDYHPWKNPTGYKRTLKPIKEKWSTEWYTFKWNPTASAWADTPELKKWCDLMAVHFTSRSYAIELWRNQHFALQHILKDYAVVYLHTGYIQSEVKIDDFIKSTNTNAAIIEFPTNSENGGGNIFDQNGWCLNPPYDCAHINQAGHDAVAEAIIQLTEMSDFKEKTSPDRLVIQKKDRIL